MMIVSICQELGWTYNEYMNQPDWFVKLLKAKLIHDNEKVKEAQNKSKQYGKRSGT